MVPILVFCFYSNSYDSNSSLECRKRSCFGPRDNLGPNRWPRRCVVTAKPLNFCTGNRANEWRLLVYMVTFFPQIDNIWTMIVWMVRGKIIKSVLWVLYATIVHSAMHAHMNRSNSCLLVRFPFSLFILCVTVYLCYIFSFLELFCLIVYLCVFAFVVLDLVSSVLCQEIGWKECLRNDLLWPYLIWPNLNSD